MKVVFAGTPDFAVPCLAAVATRHDLVEVWTRPDQPAGRGQRRRASAVKTKALALGLPVREIGTRDALLGALTVPAPDLLVVVAFGLLLPPAVLQWPVHGALNVHASLLPRWRGAAPIARAIEAGDPETGISLMQMAPGLDTGPVFDRRPLAIGPRESAGEVHDRLAALGADALNDLLQQMERGPLVAQAQDERLATYAPKLSKKEAVLVWSQPAGVLLNRIRAFNPYPVAQTSWRGHTLRIRAASPSAGTGAPGEILGVDEAGIHVAAGDGAIAVTEVQREGGRPMQVHAFVQGHRVTRGDRFGPA